jgi:AraC-like DNA-binding protein
VLTRPRISATAAIGLIDAIKKGGTDPDALLSSMGLDRSGVSDPHGFIASAAFARLLEAGARATTDDCFGLHLGEHYQPRNVGPLAYVVLNSPTFEAAIANIGRYLHVLNGAAQVSLTIDGPRAYIRHDLVGLGSEAFRQQHEYGLAVVLNTIRLMAGSQWAPAEVQFAHTAPRDVSEYARVFCAPVVFGCQANALVVEAEFLDRHVPAADDRLYQILRRYLDRAVQEMPREDGLLAKVRRVVGESLREGEPKLAPVAQAVSLTPHTLQRRLRDHGLDFNRLVNDTRRRLSLDYLRNPEHTFREVAYLLGYSEVSAFNRAFKRWTGATPSEYRRQLAR